MPTPVILQNETEAQTVTIAATASLSDAARLPNGHEVVGITMPAAWTAANLTFQASPDGSTFYNLYDDEGNEVTVTAAASRRSSMREFVQLPIKTMSIGLPAMAAPGSSPMYSSAFCSAGSSPVAGIRPSTGITMPGLVP